MLGALLSGIVRIPPISTGGRRKVAIDRIAFLVLVVIIFLYFGLVPLGQWQADEYDDFAKLAHHGWLALWQRLHWSPRPLSELVFLGYGSLVNHLRQPLIAPFLALLWCGLFAAALFPVWKIQNEGTGDRFPKLLAAIGLVAAFLCGAPTFEVFYWPAGAVAYLPTLSATLLVFLCAAQEGLADPRRRLFVLTGLLIAALSSEMGATFVVCYGITAGVVGFARTKGRYEAAKSAAIWLSVPVVLALVVLVAVRLNRYHAAEEPARVASAALGDPLASAVAAGRQLALELLGATPRFHSWIRSIPSLISELFVAGAVGLCLVRGIKNGAHSRRTQIAVTSASLLLASYLTLAATYLHFGAATGARHEAIRRCWILMSLAGFAVLGLASAKAQGLRQRATASGLGSILMVVGVLMVWHVKPLLREYSSYPEISAAIAQNFRSGFQKRDGQMEWINPPNRGVLTPATIPPGTYTQARPGSDYAGYVLIYFEKDVLVVRP